jgi:hypothetical protein
MPVMSGFGVLAQLLHSSAGQGDRHRQLGLDVEAATGDAHATEYGPGPSEVAPLGM